MDLDAIVFVKPKAYESMGKGATEELIKADQRVLSALEVLIKKGEEQLIAKTCFTNENLPDESPKTTPDIILDEIKFGLSTYVRVNNPEYSIVFDKTIGFLELLVNDWKQGIRKDFIRTYPIDVSEGEGRVPIKAPFGEWNYLMRNVLWYLSNATILGAVNEIKTIAAPTEMSEMNLERLVVPVGLVQDFDINRPGAAKIWYLARRFYDEVKTETVMPAKAKMAERTGVTVEKMPEETNVYLEQFENLGYKVMSVPSPRREFEKILSRLYEIPQKPKPKGSTALPIVPDHQNYQTLLEEFKPLLPKSLERWKELEGHIGELIVPYYDIEEHPKVREKFPFLSEYHLKREDGKMFVSIQAVYDRMKALEENYVKNRLLRVHSVVPIV